MDVFEVYYGHSFFYCFHFMSFVKNLDLPSAYLKSFLCSLNLVWGEVYIPTRPVDNVVIATKGLQDRNINILDGTTVENKGKLILTEIFPSVQIHDIV